MRILVFLLVLLSASLASALVLVENGTQNVAVKVFHAKDGTTHVSIEADITNAWGATPRHVSKDVTNKLTANQLNTASNVYNTLLGVLAKDEGVPTPTPTSTP